MNVTWTVEYQNGARSEVTLFEEAQEDVHESDRIHLRIVTAEGESLSVYMHVLEAVDLAGSLSRAAAQAISSNLPLKVT